MPEKVKLPKFMCDWLDLIGRDKNEFPLLNIAFIDKSRSNNSDVEVWLSGKTERQWKLIDALRYGYEAEPEQLYYVPIFEGKTMGYLNQYVDTGRIFLNTNIQDGDYKTKFTMPEILAIDPRYKAFAVPVEEVDGNE